MPFKRQRQLLGSPGHGQHVGASHGIETKQTDVSERERGVAQQLRGKAVCWWRTGALEDKRNAVHLLLGRHRDNVVRASTLEHLEHSLQVDACTVLLLLGAQLWLGSARGAQVGEKSRSAPMLTGLSQRKCSNPSFSSLRDTRETCEESMACRLKSFSVQSKLASVTRSLIASMTFLSSAP